MKTHIAARSTLALLLVLLTALAGQAQFDFGNFDPSGLGESGGEKVSIDARFVTAADSKAGQLQVTATMKPGWHIYSITQPAGGSMPTAIKVEPSESYQVVGEFTADQKPKIKKSDIYPVPLEEHYGMVTWTAPIELAESASAAEVKIPVSVTLQVCDEASTCIPKIGDNALQATASYQGEQADLKVPSVGESSPNKPQPPTADSAEKYLTATAEQPFSTPEWNIQFYGEVTPSVVAPGGTAQVKFTAHPLGEYHIYAWEPQEAKMVKVTQLALELPTGWAMTDPVPSQPPHLKKSEIEALPDLSYHEEPVTWTIEVRVPDDAQPGDFKLTGAAAFHTCTDTQCDAPAGLQFQVPLAVGQAEESSVAAMAFRTLPASDDTSPYKMAANRVASMRASAEIVEASEPGADQLNLDSLAVQDDGADRALIAVVGIALLGGFILNFMPCVLPVIGLKVMSFVQQAGENRAKVFALNMWYVLGMMSVFWILATMAVVWNASWGSQFQDAGFGIVMTAVVFAMALSFLGVWEIPIPGFVGSGKAAEAAEQEGPLGALLKGMLTTVLATPCSGPGLGTALAWCNGQSAPIVYFVFTALGLGMALPYIAIGIQPKLVNFLPKPGEWMDTFKQVMGFLLLATVVFFFSFMSWELIVPTLALLFGIWAGVWWIGRTPIYADFHTKVRAWAVGTAVAALIGIVSFTWLADVSKHRFESTLDRQIAKRMEDAAMVDQVTSTLPEVDHDEIPWQPFSESKLKQLAAENRTVMIDFTADWCLTCKTLEKTVLNTQPVRESLQENNVETLIADWTDGDEEITKMLNRLGSGGVPVLAIFPAGRPNEPIVLKDGYTQSIVLSKLKQAGPSKQPAPRESVAKKTQTVR